MKQRPPGMGRPLEEMKRVARILETVQMITASPRRYRRRDIRMLLQRALIEGRKVRIVHKTSSRGGDVNERIVRPYHIMPYVRSWQLIGHCEKRDTVPMYKLDLILQAKIIDQPDKFWPLNPLCSLMPQGVGHVSVDCVHGLSGGAAPISGLRLPAYRENRELQIVGDYRKDFPNEEWQWWCPESL